VTLADRYKIKDVLMCIKAESVYRAVDLVL